MSPAAEEHVCDATVPVCGCGHAWDYAVRYRNGSVVYTSELVVQRYHALYGKPELKFERVRKSRRTAVSAPGAPTRPAST